MDTANKLKKRSNRLNSVSLPAETIMHVVLILFALTCVIPFIFVTIISFTSQESLRNIGYSFIPQSWSLVSYEAAFSLGSTLWRSYLNSAIVTVIGTAMSVFICVLYSYGMFRSDFRFRRFFTFFAFFTMLFGGGLAPTVVVTRALGMSDNLAALIVPLLVSPFNFIIMRTFFKTSVSESLIEAAHIDGSGEFRTLFQIVMPIAKPGIATIALLNAVTYWNDWYLALLYLTDRSKYPIQYLLFEMHRNIEHITRNSSMIGAGSVSYRDLPSDGLRMALCVFIVVPIAFAYPFFQRYIISGLTIGSVKE